LNIAVFVSGRGTNLNAILTSKKLIDLAEVKIVISDKIDCPAFQIASHHSIKTFSIDRSEVDIKKSGLLNLLKELRIDLIVLAGFLKLLPNEIIDAFRNRVINIHPALLPSFGGKGMYGMNVHKAVYKSSAKVSGATVHFVDYTYDTGSIIAQRCIDISDVQSAEEIAERVLKLEHELLPFVIEKIAQGNVQIVNDRVVLK
jgi:formyltetrahydrofolate-dependent phosphoribosylglycinamide formyltransferase